MQLKMLPCVSILVLYIILQWHTAWIMRSCDSPVENEFLLPRLKKHALNISRINRAHRELGRREQFAMEWDRGSDSFHGELS